MVNKRNLPCPCGSGKRYKKCCGLPKEERALSGTSELHEQADGQPSAENFFQRGLISASRKDFKEAEANFQRALAIKPNFTEAYYNLGVILEEQGLENKAKDRYLQALAHDPTYINALLNLGCIFINQDNMAEADSTFQKALDLQPDNPLVNYAMGFLYKEQGKIDDAVTWVRKALALNPDYAAAYKHLTTIVKYTEVDDEIMAMENLYTKEGLSDIDRINLGFALGKAYGDLQDYRKSFAYIMAANQLKRKSYEYSIQEDHDFFARIKKIFSEDFFSSHRGTGNKDKTPIFIVGLPRSGTTLVEQILASHPQIFGAGELMSLIEIAKNCSMSGKESEQFPECMMHLDVNDLERMGSKYIEKIRAFSSNSPYITDKLPHNFWRIGLIKTILPNAKVIHCKRNPMANCFSIFKTDFTGTHRYAYDMTEIGQYYKLYLDLMEYWQKVLPGFVYTICYEELVTAQQHQTKGLLDFCGLPWDEACLAFYETNRKVSTASCVQVRQPIYNESVELWKRYEKQLEPLRKVIYG